jgi:hypothetical protein
MAKKLIVATGMCALVLAVAVFCTIRRAHGFSARERPMIIEKFLARAAREFAIPANAKARRNPVPDTLEIVAEGRAHWADHSVDIRTRGCTANTQN